MLTEQSAYSNRWRQVSPVAKGCFTLCGMIAAFTAASPQAALLLSTILAAAAILGAGIPAFRYLRVAAPPLIFLLTSGISLLVSFDFGSATGGMSLTIAEAELPHILQVSCRSLACLTALLFLALTTPLPDIISLLRRCKVPETLLDLMTLCYRTLFVLSEALHGTITAQTARLGYASSMLSLRSLGLVLGNLLLQVWQRSLALQMAAEARGNDGALRFLENRYTNSTQNVSIALAGGFLMVALAVAMP